jgi:hypothetical protein
MTPQQLAGARFRLGEMWRLGRPLSVVEMGRCLELANPKRVGDMERNHDDVSGPVSVAVKAMLSWYIPDNAPEQAWAARDAMLARVRGRRAG